MAKSKKIEKELDKELLGSDSFLSSSDLIESNFDSHGGRVTNKKKIKTLKQARLKNQSTLKM